MPMYFMFYLKMITNMFKNNPPAVRFARLETKETDVPVASHAAYDLKDLDDMRRRGVPISTTQHESQYYDGSTDATFDIPLDQLRGVDINDVWNETKRVKGKLSKAKVSKFNINPTQV